MRLPILLVSCFIAMQCSLAGEKQLAVDNPPRILIASEINSQNELVLIRYHSIYMQPASPKGPIISYNERYEENVSLKKVQIRTVGGKELTLDEAKKKFGTKERPILASSYDRLPGKVFMQLFQEDTLIFIFPEESPVWKNIQSPGSPVR